MYTNYVCSYTSVAWILLRTQLKDGQDFDDPTAIYFTESNTQSGIVHCCLR